MSMTGEYCMLSYSMERDAYRYHCWLANGDWTIGLVSVLVQ